MLIGHLPVGYITARAAGQKSGLLMVAALIGSVFPDFDMIWFLFVDDRTVHHHRYWVHAPGFWIIVAALTLPFLRGRARVAGVIFVVSVLIHIMLDTIGGGIMWLWPLSDDLHQFVTVPATQANWVLSFMAHWTFTLELAVVILAGWLLAGQKRTQ